jgi:putative ABC transport system permease protein
MFKVALRGLLARRVRLLLTAAAVALGVTLIAGTYVFTDTINRSFDRIFTATYAGIDVAVTPKEGVDSDFGEPEPLPADLVRDIEGTPGVGAVEGSVFAQATVFDKDGKRLSAGGAPNFVSSVSQVAGFNAVTAIEGRLPGGDGEAAIDKSTAEKKGFAVGDRLALQGDGPKQTLRIVGITQVAGVDNYGGATLVSVTTPDAQRILGREGEFDEIDVDAAQGTTPEQLVAALRPVVGDRAQVLTGEQEGASQATDIKDDLSFLSTALLAFAGIAVFVGGFTIFNTFSITVAQRIREFALLRTLGASRNQVLGSVLVEGLLLGVVGSAIGLGLGVLTASLLKALFSAVGVDLPSQGTVILGRTVIVALLVGVVVTMVAALAPALRATRVPPVAALREGLAQAERRSRVAPIAGAVLTLLGLGLMAVGLFGVDDETGALSLMGAGAAATFLGVALLSPRLVPPLARVVGAPVAAVAGLPGRLGRENTIRQPGRTAVTAAALMVGVALVTFAAIFTGSFRSFIDQSIDAGSKSQAIVQATDGFSPFTAQATEAVGRVPGVASVSGLRISNAEIAGTQDESGVTGVDPRTFPRSFSLQWDEGDDRVWSQLGDDGVVVSRSLADEQGLQVGSPLRLRTTTDRTVGLTVRGIHDDPSLFLSPAIVSNATIERDWGTDKDSYAFVRYEPGAQPKAQIDQLVAQQFPAAEVLTNSEFKDKQGQQVTQLLGLVVGLLALAILVSLFGIVNTLYLAISERTRELGLLRAVGTTRRQVKAMVRVEAVITSLIGSVLGLVLGGVLAVLVSRAVDDLPLTVPAGLLVVVLLVGGLAGILAAVWPARRAARLNVLDALAYE